MSDVDALVLGGGFAGVECARELERRMPRGRRVVLVSDENYFTFQPLLPEVVGGSLDPMHVVSPIRHVLRRTEVLRGRVVELDLQAAPGRAGSAQIAITGSTEKMRLTARFVVLALGSVVDVSRIPGMAEHALLMRTIADALRIRYAVLERLERAAFTTGADKREALLTFVVVGGGFSGIETAAEVLDLLRHCVRFYPVLRQQPARVVCVHSQDTVLPELSADLGRFAQRRLAHRGLEFVLGRRTRAVSGEAVYLDDGSVIPCRTVVCTVGNAPHPMLAELGLPNHKGKLVVDQSLRLQGREDVYAIGDCAHAPDGCGGIAPPTAQFAVRMGVHAARQIAGAPRRRAAQPFRHQSQGMLATLGHHNAVAAIGGIKISGILAWWMWRTIYLFKLPRLDRKLRVAIDWTLRLFFPRDLTFIDLRTTRGLTRVHLERGETLFHQGDVSAAFYVIESGHLEVTQQDDGGAIVLREQLGPGEHFGEGSLLRDGVRRTTATAIERAIVMVFRAQEFIELAESFTALKRILLMTSRRFLPADETLPRGLPADWLQRPVDGLMLREVCTLPAAATIGQAFREHAERPFGCFPVVDSTGCLTAIVTRTDLHTAGSADRGLEAPVTEIATARVHCLRPGDSIGRAIELMRRHAIQHLPVVDDQRRVVGLLTNREIWRSAIAAGLLPEAKGIG